MSESADVACVLRGVGSRVAAGGTALEIESSLRLVRGRTGWSRWRRTRAAVRHGGCLCHGCGRVVRGRRATEPGVASTVTATPSPTRS